MRRRCLWTSVINNTITEAIDYFWGDGHYLEVRTGVAGWKRVKISQHLSVALEHTLMSK